MEDIVDKNIIKFVVGSNPNSIFNQNDLLQDLVNIIKTSETNNNDYKLEINQLISFIETLNDKDLSDWLSKTGLGLFDGVVKKMKDNNSYYSAAQEWIEKRIEFARNLCKPMLELSQRIIVFQRKQENERINGTKEKIERIRSLFMDKMDRIRVLIQEILREINHENEYIFFIESLFKLIQHGSQEQLIKQMELIGKSLDDKESSV